MLVLAKGSLMKVWPALINIQISWEQLHNPYGSSLKLVACPTWCNIPDDSKKTYGQKKKEKFSPQSSKEADGEESLSD